MVALSLNLSWPGCTDSVEQLMLDGSNGFAEQVQPAGVVTELLEIDP